MTSLVQRDRQPELMDELGLDAAVHRHALAGLRRANAIGRIARTVWRAIQTADVQCKPGAPLRVLDIAAGGGDVAIGIARLASLAGVAIEIDGCDINPTAVEYAQQAAHRAGLGNAKFFRLNVLTEPLAEYDVVMSTLFMHHLAEDEARRLLQQMAAAAKRFVIVDDLCRNRLGYAYAWAGVRLLTRSRIVHIDGPLSVRAAFTTAEARRLAQQAGWLDVRIKRHWPQRFLMSWTKP